MGENQWKVNEAAKMIDESQHVVRHWLKELGQYIPTKKGENGYRYFDEEAMEALRIVQRLTRDQNFSIRQVEHYLATGGKEFAAASESPAVAAQSEEIRELREMVEKQSELMAALVTRLDEQNRKSEERAEQRDRVLMNTLREIQERNRILLEEKNDRPWWKLWGK